MPGVFSHIIECLICSYIKLNTPLVQACGKLANASLHLLTDGSSSFAANSSLIQDLTIQIDPNVSGFLKLPDLLDMMSRFVFLARPNFIHTEQDCDGEKL